jgi:hypothetical protein
MVDREELLEQRVGSLEGKVDEGFKQVDARFGRVETDVRELRGEVRTLDEKLTGKLDAQGKEVPGELKKLDEKLTGKIEALDEKLTGKIDRITIGLVLAVVGASLIDRLL